MMLSLLLIAAFIIFHVVARRLLLPKIELYYEPTPYDERKIFFDLGQGHTAHHHNRSPLPAVADRIRTALDASNADDFRA